MKTYFAIDLDKWISVCFKCLHASHFNCIYQWFRLDLKRMYYVNTYTFY